MARSLIIAAYVAKLGTADRPESHTLPQPRPDGTVLWARCCDLDQLTAMETLADKLAADGDPISVIATLRDWDASVGDRAIPEPHGKTAIRSFLDHWQPAMCIWVGGEFDTGLVSEIGKAQLNSILVDATAEGIEKVAGGWVPGALRSLLSEFEAILALDQFAAKKLIDAGAPSDVIIVTGAMEDCGRTLPCSDVEREDVANAIGTRPVWLAAAAQFNECETFCTAQQAASRRAHRLLSIIVPQDPSSARPMADKIKSRGFNVALRSETPASLDATQFYIVDTEEELGLWYRIAPITYLGGSLDDGLRRDPFEPASLGSAVLYGPQVKPYQKHAARLNAAGASQLIRSADDLGPAIENLLSADKAAKLSLAAWDVTSRGANVTNRVADYIQLRLEELMI